MDDYAGRVLADRYRLPAAVDAEPIHTRAFDTYSGQDVLIGQVPLPEIVEAELIEDGGPGADPSGYGDGTGRSAASTVVQRAMDAARAAAAIPDHPRLAQVFDVFEEGGSLWIVSELVPARTLEGLLEERPLSPYRGAEVAADILTALRALHTHGWTHRNITTRTVLVCDDGRVVLTGLASAAAEEALCGYDPLPPPPGHGEPPRPSGSPGPPPGVTPAPGPGPGFPGDPADGRLPQLPDPATGFLPAQDAARGAAGRQESGVLPPGPGWNDGPGPYGDGAAGADARGGAGPYGTPPYDEDDEVWRSAPYGPVGTGAAPGAPGGAAYGEGPGEPDEGADGWPFGAWQQGGAAGSGAGGPGGPGGHRGQGVGAPGGGQGQQPRGRPQGGGPSGGQHVTGAHGGPSGGGARGGPAQAGVPAGGGARGGPAHGGGHAGSGARGGPAAYGNPGPGPGPGQEAVRSQHTQPAGPAGRPGGHPRGGSAPASGGGGQAGDGVPAARAGVMAAYQAGTRAAEARLAAGAGGPGPQRPARPAVPGQPARTPEAGPPARPGGARPSAGAAGPVYSDRIDIGGNRQARDGAANPAPQAAGSPDAGAPWDDLPTDEGGDGYDEYGTADPYGPAAPAARGGPGASGAPGHGPGASAESGGMREQGAPGSHRGAGTHGGSGARAPGEGLGPYGRSGAPRGGPGAVGDAGHGASRGPGGPGAYGGPGGSGARGGSGPPGGAGGRSGASAESGGPGAPGPGGYRGAGGHPGSRQRGVSGAGAAPGPAPGAYRFAEPEPGPPQHTLPDSLPGGASYGGSLPGVRPGASIAVPVGAQPVPAGADGRPGAEAGPGAGRAARYPGPGTRLAAERARQTRMQVVGAVTERWAPEQAGPIHEHWQLAPPVGPAADLWALGALLFRAVQGHPAYPEEDVAELVQLVCSEPAAHAEECGALRPVVESLLRQDPTERPDFEELRGWLRSLIRTAPEPGIGSRTVTVPQHGTGRGGDPRRLPILRRRGELMRRRRANKAPVPVHAKHRRRRSRRGPRGPRSLGRTLIALIFVAMAGAIAYAAMFMPQAEEGTGNQRGSIGAGPGGEPGESAAPPTDDPDPNEPEERRQPKESDDPDKPKGDGQNGGQGDGGAGSTLPEGFTLREDPAGFEVAVREDWERVAENDSGRIRYVGGDYELVIVPGRDGVDEFGSDPLAYQQQSEPELDPYRDAAWAQADGLQLITVGQRVMAEGEFDWTESGGRQMHARNLASIWGDSYHVVLLIGADGKDAEVERFHRIAADSYRPTE